jgi:hypothetical protein
MILPVLHLPHAHFLSLAFYGFFHPEALVAKESCYAREAKTGR